jgi:uncharacterized protein RhaS with RHS repeats
MQARYYDPVVGRFYAVDPVGFDGGNPGQFGRYTYANNNPAKYVDPDGRTAIVAACFSSPVGAVVCGVSAAVIITQVYYSTDAGQRSAAATWAALAEKVGGSDDDVSSGEEAEPEPGTEESEYGCIYECDGVSEGQETPSGKPYVGSADDKERRARTARDGRNRENAPTVGKYRKGDRPGRGNAEQNRMNEKGGKGELDNKRDEVHNSKWKDRGIKPPE